MKYMFLCFGLIFVATQAFAQIYQVKPVQTAQQFGDYTVHYNVFDSTFIPSDIARTYQLTRATDQVLVNIAVTHTSSGHTSLGLPAEITGTATNLMQQQKSLQFKTIREGEVTYYLAPLRHTNQELINFVINVQPEAVQAPFTVKFNRTLYSGN